MRKDMTRPVLGLLIISILAIVSCSDPNTALNSSAGNNNRMSGNSSASSSTMNTVANAANTVANTVSNTASAMTMPSAEDFIKSAAQGGMAEVELGKLAVTKAQNPEVKKFAQMMVADHGKANNELKALAAMKNFTLPTDLGHHKMTLDYLNKTSAAEFDKEYVGAMIDDHETDVAAFQEQADRSTDADVKAFAAKTLPTLKKHLEQIKAIQAKIK